MTDGQWLVSARTERTLAGLDRRIEAAVASADVGLRTMAVTLARRGGKRLRPALLLLSAEFGAFRAEPLLDAAAALEMFHLASLYHDDVMDRAPTRRHGPSVNALWGEPAAVVAGTFLVSQATRLLAGLPDACGRAAAGAMVRLCSGQLLETESAFDTGLTEGAHLDILRRKTATLFELPCRLGALLAEVPEEQAEALAGYGAELGLAFQLADDALDLRGSAASMGKQPLNDLREGVYTLPVLRLLGRDERLRTLLAEIEPDPAQVAGRVLASGVVEEVLEEAGTLARDARDRLGALPGNAARDSLALLASYAVARAA
ncbi:polyprenyl synthetase family protein [Actinomadura sp. ATCC 39365]